MSNGTTCNPSLDLIVFLARLTLSVTLFDVKDLLSEKPKPQMALRFHRFPAAPVLALAIIFVLLGESSIAAINIEGDEEPLRKRLLYNVDGMSRDEAPFFAQEDFFLEDDFLGRELLIMSQSMSMSL